MPQNVPIVIIDSDNDAINAMVKYINTLGDHAIVDGVANSFDAGFELIHKKRPMVVIMNICEGGNVDIERISKILDRFPQVTIFATCEDTSSDTILRAMRAGAAEYLLKPISENDLASALQKLGRLWITKPAPEAATGSILTVFSPKGGVGVTTIAINLATNIFKITNKPTILVDLDLASGDVTTFLNLNPAYTISDVTINITRLDESFLKGVITKHDSGIFILSEPHKVEEGISISGADLRKVLVLLKTMFSYIVIDTESVLDERTTTTLEMSDMILLTFIMSLPGLKNIQKYLDYLSKMGYKDRVRLLVNRYVKKGDIKIEDAVKVLKFPVFWTIPNDYDDAMECLNKGVPASMGAPRSQLNLSVKDLAQTIVSRK